MGGETGKGRKGKGTVRRTGKWRYCAVQKYLRICPAQKSLDRLKKFMNFFNISRPF